MEENSDAILKIAPSSSKLFLDLAKCKTDCEMQKAMKECKQLIDKKMSQGVPKCVPAVTTNTDGELATILQRASNRC